MTLLNLDARSVGDRPWSHSPTIGAWHTGFDATISKPYSFIFAHPVGSFGLFANDVEAPINVTIHTLGDDVSFVIPYQGGADIGQFHGFVATSNEIERIDFATSDYHIIDDVQFGYVPEPATNCLLMLGLFVTPTIRQFRRGAGR